MNDSLFTIAELSVALAGFSGVVLGLRSARQGALSSHDRFGLMHILTGSGGAMLFALLPSALHAAGLEPELAERTATALLGAAFLVVAPIWGVLGRRTQPRFPMLFWSFVVSGALLGVALLVTSLWLPGPGTLLPLALMWLLGLAFAQFVVFLALLWSQP